MENNSNSIGYVANGLFLGCREWKKTDKKTGLISDVFSHDILIWNDKQDDFFIEPQCIKVHSDAPLLVGCKVFSKVVVDVKLQRDFKSGFLRPSYSNVSLVK